MKKFNKVIQVEVSVDTIANSLLETMNEAFPHREMVVEAIIGGANTHQMSLLYNSLNGYTNEINFQKGNGIIPHEVKAYGYWEGKDQPQSYRQIQEATIEDIDIYSKTKLFIKYLCPNSNGVNEYKTQWISHIGCELIVEEKVAS